MGFIGAEVAASLRTLGCDVTVVEVFETTLYRILGPEIGRVLEGIHRDHGVAMVFNDTVASFEGDGRVEARRHERRPAHRVRRGRGGVGHRAVGGADGRHRAGPGGGIPVGPTLETAIPGVFAIGDVADHDHPVFGPVRVEHYDNAMKMGDAVARNMLGAGEVFDDPHWFWSDQYDHQIQMAGYRADVGPHGGAGVARGALVLRVPAGRRRRRPRDA